MAVASEAYDPGEGEAEEAALDDLMHVMLGANANAAWLEHGAAPARAVSPELHSSGRSSTRRGSSMEQPHAEGAILVAPQLTALASWVCIRYEQSGRSGPTVRP